MAHWEQHNIFGGIDVVETDPLRDRFEEPPFSVIRGNTPDWYSAKRQWFVRIGGKTDNRENMEEKGMSFAALGAVKTDVSMFDPRLCEVLLHWFSKEGDKIYDPFAGGNVRGAVAARMRRHYVGIDVRQVQVDENTERQTTLEYDTAYPPQWICGDSASEDFVSHTLRGGEYDMVLSCPPYGNLEVYSTQANDISNMPQADFLTAYQRAITHAYYTAKKGAFAVWVVGEYRDKDGNYVNFVGETIAAFMRAGWKYYNEGIFLTPLGSAPQRANRQFTANQKLVKVHQNILVFRK